MSGIYRFFIRISAFVTKEIREILRQPWLVISLIFGPFLILALFGVGYKGGVNQLKAVVVAPPDPVLAQTIEEYGKSLGAQVALVGIEQNGDLSALLEQTDAPTRPRRHAAAAALLKQYNADVITSFPPNAATLIASGQQAPLNLYYNTVDPVEAQYISSFGLIYTYEINRRVLSSAAQQTQGDATTLSNQIAEIQNGILSARRALQAVDRVQSGDAIQRLNQSADRLTTNLDSGLGLLAGLEASVGGNAASQARDARQAAEALRADVAALRGATANAQSFDAQGRLADLDRIQANVNQLASTASRFNSIPPGVLAAPFVSASENVAIIQPNFVTYYAPGVLALMLQHLAVSMAALSLVRERMLGSIEVFRVGPMTPLEALLGKYISYIMLVLMVGVILLILLVVLLGVPIQGSVNPPTLDHVLFVVGELLLLVMASLGIGFVISAFSSSDSQAVQLSMLVLLASIFFSGFFLPLSNLSGLAAVVSLLLPVTYAIQALKSGMLEGQSQLILQNANNTGLMQLLNVPLLMLLFMSVVLFIAALSLFRRLFEGE